MRQRIREVRENESGFTLIELLIVIVILGVLAGIVVFAVGAFNDDGKASACKSDKKNVEIASEAFYAKSDPHKYPTQMSDLTGGSKPYLKESPTNVTVTFDNTGASAPTSACA
jgi:general secretion pathway protein G